MNGPNTSVFNCTESFNLTQSGSSNRSVAPWLITKPSTDSLLVTITILFAVLTLLLNGLILTGFLRHPQLRTPFNTYVVNIAVIDIVLALTALPKKLILHYYGHWPYGGLACSVLLYISSLGLSANRTAHLLIAANRLWAVTFPLSYRNQHTKRRAVITVLVSWTLVVCMVTPQVITGRLTIDHSLTGEDPICGIDTNRYWAYHMVFEVVVFSVPEVLILVAYLSLMFKLRQMRLRRIKDDCKGAGLGNDPEIEKSTRFIFVMMKKFRPPARVGTSKVTVGESQQTNSTDQTDKSLPGTSAVRQQNRQSAMSRSNNRLFTYLVMALICCWTPNNVFFLLSDFTGYWNELYFNVQIFLVYGNSWLNPILFYVADREIRKVVNEFLKCSLNFLLIPFLASRKKPNCISG